MGASVVGRRRGDVGVHRVHHGSQAAGADGVWAAVVTTQNDIACEQLPAAVWEPISTVGGVQWDGKGDCHGHDGRVRGGEPSAVACTRD